MNFLSVAYKLFHSISCWHVKNKLLQGPDPLAADQPYKILGKEITDEERRRIVLQAYEQLKATFEQFQKPAGDKKAPAKTCRDLFVAHPELRSGNNPSAL